MPRRTNLFQQVIAALYEHLAVDTDQRVQESGELLHSSGVHREVDVVIEGTLAGQPIIVGVEATATKRKADLTWVEGRLQKHEHLPTDKLILVSQAGFTGPAERHARQCKAIPLSPAALAGDEPGAAILTALREIRAREISYMPIAARIAVQKPLLGTAEVNVPTNTVVFDRAGSPLANLSVLFVGRQRVEAAEFHPRVMAILADESSLAEVDVQLRSPWCVQADGRRAVDEVFVRWEETMPFELHRLEVVEITAVVSLSVEMLEVHPRRLGDLSYAYATRQTTAYNDVIIATASDDGARFTVRRGKPTGD